MTEARDTRSFPHNRAFVVQFDAGADVTRGAVLGRVEHVVSAHAAHFRTLDELLGFVARVLSQTAADDPIPSSDERDQSAPGCRA